MAEPNSRPAPAEPRPRPTPPGRRLTTRGGARPEPRGPAAPVDTASPRTSGRQGWRDIPAPVRWLGAAFVLLLTAVAIFLALFRWNWLRGPVEDYASAQLQRQVVIHGDLTARPWSWTPSATARDVTVSEPPWAGKGQMARLPSLTVALDLKALLRGRLVLGAVDAERPIVVLRRDASGRDNWNFGAPAATPKPLKLPPIRHFTISDGAVTLDDARRRLHFAGRVSSNERLTGYGRGRFTLNGQGTLNGRPFLASILGGPLVNVDPDKPYPFQSDIRAGATHVVAQGAIPHPFDLAGR